MTTIDTLLITALSYGCVVTLLVAVVVLTVVAFWKMVNWAYGVIVDGL